MNEFTRRDFLQTATAVGISSILPISLQSSTTKRKSIGDIKPLVISSGNGLRATEKAMELIKNGADALDAVIAGVNIIEDDPNDMSVGYGGLPNEEGIVELDSSVMHGPTYRAGAVAALRNIKNPSQVAKVVMERSDHVLIVGYGALKFARVHGFKEMDLLTDKAREIWLKWKETMSTMDDWLPPHSVDDTTIGEYLKEYKRHYGTINCDAIDLQGNISGVTTTSGLAFKIPGRVGDSPIIGAGLFVDNEVGAAGSTGRGETNMVNCSCVLIVEYMRQGKSPEEACIMMLKRILKNIKEKRLLDDEGKPKFGLSFYALNKKGEYGGAAFLEGARMAVNDGIINKHFEMAYLFKKK
jgi:N4-(beta-N-acetylglucosaminyl)-L-asparaginase